MRRGSGGRSDKVGLSHVHEYEPQVEEKRSSIRELVFIVYL